MKTKQLDQITVKGPSGSRSVVTLKIDVLRIFSCQGSAYTIFLASDSGHCGDLESGSLGSRQHMGILMIFSLTNELVLMVRVVCLVSEMRSSCSVE